MGLELGLHAQKLKIFMTHSCSVTLQSAVLTVSSTAACMLHKTAHLQLAVLTVSTAACMLHKTAHLQLAVLTVSTAACMLHKTAHLQLAVLTVSTAACMLHKTAHLQQTAPLCALRQNFYLIRFSMFD